MECHLPRITIHYEVVGEGQPFVTISGAPGDHRIVASWLEPLFESRPGWQRFYFDLPGTGQTPSADWIRGSDEMLDVVCDFIDAMIVDRRFTLLGLSYGGYLARGVVHRIAERVDGLCLLVPWLSDHEDQTLPAPKTFVRDPALLAELAPDEAERFDSLTVIQNREILAWYRDSVILARAGADWDFLQRIVDNYRFSFDIDRSPKPFEKPALILTGRQDTHVGYRDGWGIFENYPRATFAVLDRAGHALGVEQKALFSELVNEWLDRIEEDRTAR